MVSTSRADTTASSSTSQNSAIFALIDGVSGCSLSVRQSSTSGWIPMARSSLTECWVALVLSSEAAWMNGTRVRCT